MKRQTKKRKTWRCFFCDEVFRSARRAREHFGSDEMEGFERPGCVDPLRIDEQARLKELHAAHAEVDKLRKELQEAEEKGDLFESLRSELERYFGKGATTPWIAHDRMVSMRNSLNDEIARIKGKV